MKINVVYIGCCKLDFYLTRICVASIRYWNNRIPIILIKDLSRGWFETDELERLFNVSTALLTLNNIGPYGKLHPFVNLKDERVFLIDSDTVWLGDMISYLEQYDEDIVLQSYSPENYIDEMNKWYFNTEQFFKIYKDYCYPGFLFNSGQILFNSSVFSTTDLIGIIEWKENLKPIFDDVFLCEDQGILNYIIAKKIKCREITIRSVPLYVGGWSDEAKVFTVEDIKQMNPNLLIIHWFGEKKGLVTSLPNKTILKFYEDYYYSKLKNGFVRLHVTRFIRTIKHIDVLLYYYCKVIYYKLLRRIVK